MGTSKKFRNKVTGRPEKKVTKLPSDPELLRIREQQILPVIENLQSPNLETRSLAANLISNFIEKSSCRKLLLREQIVKILLEKIIPHSDLQTRADGWNILRSLAQEEEADFCVHLFRQDILVAIDSAIKSIIQTIESTDPPLCSLSQVKQDFLWNLINSIVNLLRSLSESPNEVVEAISESTAILNFLFGLISLKTCPTQVQIEVLSCLISLTEDNQLIAQQIVKSDNRLKILCRLKESTQVDAVYACAALHNIFSSIQWSEYNSPDKDKTDAALIPVLTKFIEKFAGNESNDQSHPNIDQVLQIALEVIASIAASFQEAIEHASSTKKEIAGINIENAANEDIDMEKRHITGEMNDEEIDADMEMLASYEFDENKEAFSTEATLDLLVREATPKILRMLGSTRISPGSINEHALAALNNITWTISNIDDSLAHLATLRKVWDALAQEIWDQTISLGLEFCTADGELASLITSLAWALARCLKGAITLKQNEAQKFIALYQTSKNQEKTLHRLCKTSKKTDDAFQSLGVKCIGVLGNLAREPATIEQNRQISRFLVAILLSLPNVPPADVVESLNQIFDIYSDCSYSFDEPVFWGDDLYNSLEGIQPKVRQIVKTIDKRKFTELRIRADEALLNLGRFLIYKRKERANQMDIQIN